MSANIDFYVETGEQAQWLGSIASDDDIFGSVEEFLKTAKTKKVFCEKVEQLLKRNDAIRPSEGWPWLWPSSSITDCVYYFTAGKVSWEPRTDWPIIGK